MARLWLELDDGHKVELEYDGSYLFMEATPEKPGGDYLKGMPPERLRKYGHIIANNASPMRSYMIFAVCDPNLIIDPNKGPQGESNGS